MIVHHADRLHVRVNYGGANKIESAFFQILAEFFRQWRLRRDFREAAPVVLYGSAVDELPLVIRKAAKLFLDSEERASILDRRCNFEPISNDARIVE